MYACGQKLVDVDIVCERQHRLSAATHANTVYFNQQALACCQILSSSNNLSLLYLDLFHAIHALALPDAFV